MLYLAPYTSGGEEGKPYVVVTLGRASPTPAVPIPTEAENRYNNRSVGSLTRGNG